MSSEYFPTILAQISLVNETITELKTKMQMLQSQLRTIEKISKKEESMVNKKIEKHMTKMSAAESNKKKPSGFAKPSKVSNELCEFLNKTEGTELARTDVTKSVVAYIKENCLQSSTDKKNIIMPDDKLKSLLGISDEDKLTYFNLQKYMNKHFIKVDTVSAEEN